MQASGLVIKMIDARFWTNCFNDPPITFFIFGLIFLNLISLFFAIRQTHRFTKMQRLLNKNMASDRSLGSEAAKSFSETPELSKDTNNSTDDKSSLLKIDRAVKMLQSGASLSEIEVALDIEPSYVTILKTHYTDNV